VIIDRLTVIGVGLIGGSLAQALRESGEVGEVVGCDLSIDNLQRAFSRHPTPVDSLLEYRWICG